MIMHVTKKESLEQDLQRIHSAGLWAAVPGSDENDASLSSSGEDGDSDCSSVDSESNSVGGANGKDQSSGGGGSGGAGGAGTSPVCVRHDLNGSNEKSPEIPKRGGDPSSYPLPRLPRTPRMKRSETVILGGQPVRPRKEQGARPLKPRKEDEQSTAAASITAQPSLVTATGGSPSVGALVAPAVAAAALKTGDLRKRKSNRTGVIGGRPKRDRKLFELLFQQGKEAATEADNLRKQVAQAKDNASKVVIAARESEKGLIQARARALKTR